MPKHKNSILDHRLISNNYFYPSYSKLEKAFFIQSGKNKLACLYKKVPNSKKTIIHFHGNGEVVSEYIDSDIISPEYSVLYAEYRRYGASEGEKPTLTGILQDVENIIKAVDTPLEDIILFGRSVGSIYALHGAYLFPTIGGLIIESGISDVLARVLLRVSPKKISSTMDELVIEDKKYFDHEMKIKKFQGKTLILHTKHDSLVHSSNAVELYKWANKPKSLHLFDRGDHNDIFYTNYSDYISIVDDFIASV